MSTNLEPPQIRVLGPYPFRDQFRCVVRNGHRKIYMAPEKTTGRALAVAERFVAELTASQPLTIAQALDAYREYKLTVKANKPRSVETSGYRLRRFFIELGLAVHLLTPRRCTSYYEKLTKEQRPDTHQATLSAQSTHRDRQIREDRDRLIRRIVTAGSTPW